MRMVSAQISAIRAANSSRPGYGARSAPISTRRDSDRSVAAGAMLHLDDSRGAEPHEVLRGIDEANADGKALRDDHPIERALDIGDGARNVDAVGVEHAGAETLDDAFDRHRTVDHRIDCRAVTYSYGVQIGLSEI